MLESNLLFFRHAENRKKGQIKIKKDQEVLENDQTFSAQNKTEKESSRIQIQNEHRKRKKSTQKKTS